MALMTKCTLSHTVILYDLFTCGVSEYKVFWNVNVLYFFVMGGCWGLIVAVEISEINGSLL